MRLSLAQIESDWRDMTDYICQRIPSEGTRVVLASGEDGETWAELYPLGDEETGWELHMEKSDESVDLREVYDYFRHREMSSLELRQEREFQLARWKVIELEEEVRKLREQSADSFGDHLLHVRHKVDVIEQLIRGRSGSDGGSVEHPPSQSDSAGDLPPCLSSRATARLLGVDRKTLNKFRRDGLLKWRLKNPFSSRKEFLYERESVLALATDFRIGESAPRPETRRRRADRTYVPKHIKLE